MLLQDIQVFLGFANYYQQIMKTFSQIVIPLIFILHTTNGLISNKLIFTEDSICGVDFGKVIVEANSIRFETRFFTLGTRLAIVE